MDALKQQIEGLPTDEWEALLAWVVGPERDRRQALPLVEQATTEVITGLQDAGELTAPEAGTVESWTTGGVSAPAWVNPGTLHHRMYHRGDVVSHQGRVWESMHPSLNHWEPGSVGVDHRIWRDITDEYMPEVEEPVDPEPPAGEAPPYSVGVSYDVGSRFTWEGRTWEVLQAHTSAAPWPPDQAPSLYKAVV